MDNSTPRLTEKEIREVYETFSKEKLINILVKDFMDLRKINDQNQRSNEQLK